MAKKLRWGFLSTARINRALIPPLRSSQRNELVAVASRSLERAQAYAREHAIPRAYGSYEDLLANPEIDVIYNSLPNHLHAEWTVKALRAGKHVLCEKPFATRLEDVDAMIQAAQESGRVLTEAFMYRHHPKTLRVKELLDSGAIGRVRALMGSFTFFETNMEDIRLVPEYGGGSIWDVGCYPISYTRAMLEAEPLEVFGYQVTGPTGVDMTFAGQMRFPNEVLAQFTSGFNIAWQSYMLILGEEGNIYVPSPFRTEDKVSPILRRGDKVEEVRVRWDELYQGEVEDMADAILDGKPPRISLADSRANVAAILALLESARTGRPVQM